MKRQNCNSWALYDGRIGSHFHDSVSSCLAFFDVLNIEPDFAIYTTETTQSKPITVDKACHMALDPAIQSVTFYSAGRDDFAESWNVLLSAERDTTSQLSLSWNDQIAPLCSPDILTYLTQLIVFLEPSYGIAYEREFAKGPEFFAVGMSMGFDYTVEGNREGDKIGAWMRETLAQNRHRKGFFRDVFPFNVLNEEHISTKVDGRDFLEWGGTRGTIEQLGRHNWIWRVPPEFIPIARQELKKRLIVEMD